MSRLQESSRRAGTEAVGNERRGPSHSARVAMIGAGQLARMTLQAATSLDVRLEVLAAHDGQPAARAGAPWTEDGGSEVGPLLDLASRSDVVTFDHELVPPDVLAQLEESGALLRPGPAALRMASDKLHARRQLAALGFPVPRFAAVSKIGEASRFASEVGWPLVLKSISGGYDGRGVRIAADRDEVAAILNGGGVWLAEELIDIALEVSIIVARNPSGFVEVYPIAHTVQRDGICREVTIPADIPPGLATEIRDLAVSLVSGIDACGVIAVEMFITVDANPVICEIATRPHNSGHATIEGCVTSQFENHLRGILDWPLGSPALRAPAVAMVNVLGGADGRTPDRLPAALAVEGASIHLYGKTELPGRKIGHVTAIGDDPRQALERASTAAAALAGRGTR